MSEEIKEPRVSRHWHDLYIEKESDPTDLRSDTQFCTDLGLELGSFRNWKSKFRTFIYREVEARRKQFRNEHRALGYKALMKKLTAGDTNAIKLHFQLLGDLVEKQEIKTESMSDVDKKRFLESLRSEVGQRLTQHEKASKAGDGAPALRSEPSEPTGTDKERTDSGPTGS